MNIQTFMIKNEYSQEPFSKTSETHSLNLSDFKVLAPQRAQLGK